MHRQTATESASSVTPQETSTTTAVAAQALPRRTRRYRKRVKVGLPPRPAPAVRELWKRASQEERVEAHRKGVLVLSMWLGRKGRSEVARELSLPPLRVWQLSQMALSGMLAGLLKQPRRWRGKEAGSMNEEESPSRLRKRIAELERENRDLKEVLELITQMPKPEESPSTPKRTAAAGDSPGPKRTKRTGRARGRSPGADRSGPAGAGTTPLG